MCFGSFHLVIARLDRAIHAFCNKHGVVPEVRCSRAVKQGHDEVGSGLHTKSRKACVDNANTFCIMFCMDTRAEIAEVNIHLRARARDRILIDQAAELVGANRSQFMMASAIKEAKNILLEQSTIHADAKTFNKVMDWMDSAATGAETAGMKRIAQAKMPW